ncbi:MAG: hypothetical protein EKK46_04505 [Rhodocyclaceae bacterium]|nr:MAG: hypothetical protein EKK46_04505 [Rhodocyclaceae bacterium]
MIPIKNPVTLGTVLRGTRTALNIPAADMAAFAKTNVVSLRKMEQGKPTAAIQTLFSLLDQLGVELYASLPPQAGDLRIPEAKTPPRRTRVKL